MTPDGEAGEPAYAISETVIESKYCPSEFDTD